MFEFRDLAHEHLTVARCAFSLQFGEEEESAMPADHLEAQVNPQRMQCMEVWGGNQGTDTGFEMPGLRVWLYSRPHANARAGGDVYYLSSCASGRITRLLLADVSGHGEKVDATATRLRDIMRKNINRIEQKSLTASVNERFTTVAGDTGEFATAIVSTYFAPTKVLTLTVAGHPMPMIFRRSTRKWEVLTPDEPKSPGRVDLPLGVDNKMRFSELSLRLETGDRVLLYSDGLSESRDQLGNLLHARGLRALLESLDASATDHFLESMVNKTLEWNEANLDHDDVTAILLEATSTRTRMIDNVLAPFRLVRSVIVSDQ